MPPPKQKPGRSRQNYRTPANFIEAVKRRLGITDFAHDFAADSLNTKAPTYFDRKRDALSVPHWEDYTPLGTWGWLNPPFDDIGPWAERCASTRIHGAQIAFLIPASVGANWYRDHVHGKAHVLLLNGRLAFMPSRPKWLYPKDCVLALYGKPPGYSLWTWKDALK